MTIAVAKSSPNLLSQPNSPTNLILDKVSYVDTVYVLLKYGLSEKRRSQLKSVCDKEGTKVYYFTWKQAKRNPKYTRQIQLQQPTNTVLATLDTLLNNNTDYYCIQRVDVSLDLITRSRQDATILQNYLQKHQCMRRPPGGRLQLEIRSTLYWFHLTARRNMTGYTTRPSKGTGQPCAHLEYRFMNAQACKTKYAGFRTLPDIVNLDHRQFWAHHLWLKAIEPLKLDRAIRKAASQVHANEVKRHRDKALGKFRPLTKLQYGRVFKHIPWTYDDTLRWYKQRLANAVGTEYRTITPDAIHEANAERLRKVCKTVSARALVDIDNSPWLP